ncbi:unnamed protein product [Protopolystoma xenopodis]|uniref:Uncharacterized protein n=1 Tax=Protopolystoma xenopodis TaxID=117903 RepID=A0A3S5BBX5_9PLAT|nr:unnamed protein product [Protopolystoma xenopodis]
MKALQERVPALMVDERSTDFYPRKERMPLELHQSEQRIKAKRLQYNRNQLLYSGEINLRMSSSCILNEDLRDNIFIKQCLLRGPAKNIFSGRRYALSDCQSSHSS